MGTIVTYNYLGFWRLLGLTFSGVLAFVVVKVGSDFFAGFREKVFVRERWTQVIESTVGEAIPLTNIIEFLSCKEAVGGGLYVSMVGNRSFTFVMEHSLITGNRVQRWTSR